MNKSFLVSAILLSLFLGCRSAPNAAKSDLLRAAIEGQLIGDLRTLFRHARQIEELEARRVCFVDISGISTAKGEVFVRDGSSLATVVKSFRGN
jgi:hypothetical protein